MIRKIKSLTRQEELIRYKNAVKKQFPNAVIKQYHDKYYVEDGEGNKIKSKDFDVSNSNTVFGAWKQAKLILQNIPIIERNFYKFSDDKIYDSFVRIKPDKNSKLDKD
jgi:uncharacterized membrane-anchored protein